jgi:N utilization substance protein A
MEVKSSPRGPQIILSRAHRNFLRRLLENEVPEIYHGLVEIRSISREPGQRSKVAVAALQAGVDPVGACVGIRGVRIQAIVRELNEEKIDVIEWNSDPAAYIAKALSPARVTGVYLNEQAKGAKTATVVVPEDQLSLAIGRDGQNARLAAKLTGWRIDIKSLPEAASDSLFKLQNQPEYAFLLPTESEVIPQVEVILAKKAEGRAVTPEEYSVLSQLVDRVERGLIRQRQAEARAKEDRQKATRALVPDEAFSMPLETLNLPDRIFSLLSEAGYHNVGDLRYQMLTNPDSILGLNGIGPKAIQEIETNLGSLEILKPKEEPVPAEAEIPAEEAPVAVEAPPVEAVAEAAEAAAVVADQPAVEEVAQVPAEAVEAVAEVEAPSEPAVEAVGEAVVEEKPAEAEEEEEANVTFDELFALKPGAFVETEEDEDEEEDEDGKKKGKKGKKKKKFVEMEYDPDADVMVVKKKRKRGGAWDDDWEL